MALLSCREARLRMLSANWESGNGQLEVQCRLMGHQRSHTAMASAFCNNASAMRMLA